MQNQKHFKEQSTYESKMEDYYQNYLSKKMRNLNKKISQISALQKKSNLNEDQLIKIQKKKILENQLEQLQRMKQHYQIALTQKQKQIKSDKDHQQLTAITNFCKILASGIVYGNLCMDDTIVKENLREIKDYQIFQQFKKKILIPFQKIQKTNKLSTVIDNHTNYLINILKNKQLNQYLNHAYSLKFNDKTLQQVMRQIVLQVRQQESDNQDKSKSKPLKQKNKSSSQDSSNLKKLTPQHYQGDQQVFTGQSDSKFGSPGDIKRKRFIAKKKGNKATKKYIEEQNYYASYQERQKHKNYKGPHWRIKGGQHQFDTDKQKVCDDVSEKK